MKQFRPMKIMLALIAVAMAWTGNAKAELGILIQEDSSTIYSASAASFESLNVPSGQYGDFLFSGFTASSSQATAEGDLGGEGSIASTSAATHTLTILVSDDGFTLPTGPNYTMGSSSGYSFTPANFPNAYTDTLSFQSFATAGSDLFGNERGESGVSRTRSTILGPTATPRLIPPFLPVQGTRSRKALYGVSLVPAIR